MDCNIITQWEHNPVGMCSEVTSKTALNVYYYKLNTDKFIILPGIYTAHWRVFGLSFAREQRLFGKQSSFDDKAATSGCRLSVFQHLARHFFILHLLQLFYYLKQYKYNKETRKYDVYDNIHVSRVLYLGGFELILYMNFVNPKFNHLHSK
jgi:hypothetical protein